MQLKFTKIREVKSPVRAHPTDAGIDFFIPTDLKFDNFTNQGTNLRKDSWERHHDSVLISDSAVRLTKDMDTGYVKQIMFLGHGSILIPLGVKVSFPKGYALIFFNKSGVAANKHLVVGSCVIDSDYQGELILNLNNICADRITVNAGDKIIQGILLPVEYATVEECPDEKSLYQEISDRGAGGFGSTGN